MGGPAFLRRSEVALLGRRYSAYDGEERNNTVRTLIGVRNQSTSDRLKISACNALTAIDRIEAGLEAGARPAEVVARVEICLVQAVRPPLPEATRNGNGTAVH